MATGRRARSMQGRIEQRATHEARDAMLEWVIERLFSLIGPAGTLLTGRRELKDNALRSVSHALFETKLYYRDLRRGSPRYLEPETQLSCYWSAAAIPFRHFDQELAAACDGKANYWLSPESFSDEKSERWALVVTVPRPARYCTVHSRFASGRRSRLATSCLT